MTIRYRYLDEDWIEIDGDSYEITPESITVPERSTVSFDLLLQPFKFIGGEWQVDGQPYTANASVYIFYPAIVKLDAIPYNGETFEMGGLTVARRLGVLRKYYLDPNGSFIFDNTHTATSVTNSSGDEGRGIVIGSASNYRINNSSTVDSYCTFQVFKEGQTIHLESREVCPEVEETQECPENTCKVRCDTHYCCYNSQGIAVDSFPVE